MPTNPTGFPASETGAIVYEAIGVAATSLANLNGRVSQVRTAGEDVCAWLDGDKPEITDMATTTEDFGTPYDGPQVGAQLWSDRCPYDAAVSWPVSGDKDIQADVAGLSLSPTPTLTSGSEVVLQRIITEDFTRGGIGDGKSAVELWDIGTFFVHSLVYSTPDTDLRTLSGKNRYQAGYSKNLSGLLKLTDIGAHRGLVLEMAMQAWSETVTIENDPASGAPVTLPAELVWNLNCTMGIYALCDLTKTSQATPLARQSFTDKLTSRIVPVPIPVVSGNTAWEKESKKARATSGTVGSDPDALAHKVFTAGTSGWEVDPAEMTGKADIVSRTEASFSLDKTALDTAMAGHLADFLAKMAPAHATTIARQFPWAGTAHLRAIKQASRLEFYIPGTQVPSLIANDPFIDRILVASAPAGTLTTAPI